MGLELLTGKEQRKLKATLMRAEAKRGQQEAAHDFVTRNWDWIARTNVEEAVRQKDLEDFRKLLKEKEMSVDEWLDYYAGWRRDRGVLLVRCAQFGE